MYLIKHEHCTGCGACEAGCPKHAIKMTLDNGFYYPIIDEEKCIHCKICASICERANQVLVRDFTPHYYTVIHKDKKVRDTSSSGGMFALIASEYIVHSGVVYGAAFDEEWNVRHFRCENMETLERIKRSKYVQSSCKDVFPQVEEDLKSHRPVLFSGTACQCNGLRAYLEKHKCDTENLLLIDLICHGVPSPVIWREYVAERVRKRKARITSVDFRCKEKSWRDFVIRFDYSNRKTDFMRQNEDPFLVLFFHNMILRESCYDCRYANTKRVSDMTIGDFWGIWEYKPELFDDKGASVVMINTEKGEKIFNSVREKAVVEPITEKELVTHQNNLKHPSQKNAKCASFWMDYSNNGIKFVLRKYADDTILGRIKRKYIYSIIRNLGLMDVLIRLKSYIRK